MSNFYSSTQPNLVDPIFKQKIFKILTKDEKNHWTIISIKNFYKNYIQEHIFLVIILVLLGLFLYHRYKAVKKKEEDKMDTIDLSELTLDDLMNTTTTPPAISTPSILNNKHIAQQIYPNVNIGIPAPTTNMDIAPLQTPSPCTACENSSQYSSYMNGPNINGGSEYNAYNESMYKQMSQPGSYLDSNGLLYESPYATS